MPALPHVFAHAVIAEHYQQGRFSSRLEAELADILWNGQPVNALREVTLVPIRSFRLDECEALEAKPRQSTNRLSIFAE